MKGFTIKGQHDRAQRRQLVVQLKRLAAVEKRNHQRRAQNSLASAGEGWLSLGRWMAKFGEMDG
jgi:hypothetical protein